MDKEREILKKIMDAYFMNGSFEDGNWEMYLDNKVFYNSIMREVKKSLTITKEEYELLKELEKESEND